MPLSNNQKRRGNTSEYRQLDSFDSGKAIRILRQKNRESADTTIHFPDGRKIGCTLFLDRVKVMYGIKAGTENEIIQETIHFSGVPNTFGGDDRIYFICPQCGRRSRYLYLIPPRFKCRICAKLIYITQQSTDNEMLAARKIMRHVREKLRDTTVLPLQSLTYHVPSRPKGMHHATYDRLLAELTDLQSEYIKQGKEKKKRQREASAIRSVHG